MTRLDQLQSSADHFSDAVHLAIAVKHRLFLWQKHAQAPSSTHILEAQGYSVHANHLHSSMVSLHVVDPFDI
jgi:hypothetical protein